MPLNNFDPREHALLLDVDGTLLDIAPTPQAVEVPPSLRAALLRLHRQANGAVALVSGRSLADLDHIFAPLAFAAVGGHGAEIRHAAGGTVSTMYAAPLDPELRRRLTQIADGKKGIIVEDKGYSLALHFRLAQEQQQAVCDAVSEICAELASDTVEVLPGKSVIEVKRTGFNKGRAVQELMKHAPFAGRTPIFVGDDTTDEAAFAVMPEFGGVGISVGRKVPGIQTLFSGAGEVRDWLEKISEPKPAPRS